MRFFVEFLKRRYAPRGAHLTFSQSGEDVCMQEILKKFGIHKPTYVDIGAHHPIFGNNTYLFYRLGGTGIIVEPNESLKKLSEKKRTRDTVLHAGAGPKNGSEEFFSFPQSTRSIFSESQAKEWEKTSGQKPVIFEIPIVSLDSILAKHFPKSAPHIVSIDAEGYDFEILSGFSWSVRPTVFCVESVESEAYTNGVTKRNEKIYEIFRSHGYEPYAETPANTIFADTMTPTSKP